MPRFAPTLPVFARYWTFNLILIRKSAAPYPIRFNRYLLADAFAIHGAPMGNRRPRVVQHSMVSLIDMHSFMQGSKKSIYTVYIVVDGYEHFAFQHGPWELTRLDDHRIEFIAEVYVVLAIL